MRWETSSQGRARRGAILSTALAGVSLLTLAGGGWILVQHSQSRLACPGRLPAAIILLVLAVAQLRIAWSGWRNRTAATLHLELHPLFWRWESSGPVVCYLAALMQGPGAGALFFFLAALAAWHTLAIVPLAMSVEARQRWSRWLAIRSLRLGGWATFVALGLGAMTESSVQLYSVAAAGRPTGAYVAHCCALTPGLELRGRRVNERGYWDEHLPASTAPGLMNVAAIGDCMLLGGSAQTNHLTQVEQRIPLLQIRNFGRPHVGPREYAAQLVQEVSATRPQLVLVYISIADDIVGSPAAPALCDFDWRGLATFQVGFCSFARPGNGRSVPAPNAEAADREIYLQRSATRLTVCRTPIDAERAHCWNEALAQLARIVGHCRSCGAEVALVLIPGEFQVSATLCDSLRRHAGYEPQQLDLDLPQRRLTEFASRQNVPVLDLLPHFRASSQYPYERNDHHWNDHGNAIAADAVAHWLQRRYGAQVAAISQASR